MFAYVGSEVVGAAPPETPQVAKNAKMGQTNVQFNSPSTGGSIESESLSDAEEQAKKANSYEALRDGSQASEEAKETKREGGQCGRPEKRTLLAVFQRERGNLMRSPCANE